MAGTNVCEGKKPSLALFENSNCTLLDGVTAAVAEQAGANVTAGYKGLLDATGRVPITGTYLEAGLCPVNVHWHLGTEHLSVGEYDEYGSGPVEDRRSRRLGADVRKGFQCHH